MRGVDCELGRLRLAAFVLERCGLQPGDAVVCEARPTTAAAAAAAGLFLCTVWPERRQRSVDFDGGRVSLTHASPRCADLSRYPNYSLSVAESPHVAQLWHVVDVAPASSIEVHHGNHENGDDRTALSALVGLVVAVGAGVRCDGGSFRVRLVVPRYAPFVRVEATTTIVVLKKEEEAAAAEGAVRETQAAGPSAPAPPALDVTLAAAFEDDSAAPSASVHLSAEQRCAFAALRELLLLPAMHRLAVLSESEPLRDVLGTLLCSSAGVLLYGPSGCGKSTLLRECVDSANRAVTSAAARFHPLLTTKRPPGLIRIFPLSMSKASEHGNAEEYIRSVFAVADAHARGGEGSHRAAADPTDEIPSVAVIAIDCVDIVAPSRSGANAALSASKVRTARRVAQLLTLIDGARFEARQRVVVVAMTEHPDAVDAALRRPGRLDKELSIPPPNREGRAAVLRCHTRSATFEQLHRSSTAAATLDAIARDHCVGFSCADLEALASASELCATKRSRSKCATGEEGPTCDVILDDVLLAREAVAPSLLQSQQIQVTDATRALGGDSTTSLWDTIGGLHGVKTRLQQSIIWPLQHPAAFKRLGLQPPRGVLLYGPPGCGKTKLVQVLASTAGATFFTLSGADVYSCFVGEAEATIRAVFARARSALPSLIFFDEVDALVGNRGVGAADQGANVRLLSTLLNEMDGVENIDDSSNDNSVQDRMLLVVGATNRPALIDAALLRPGRFDKLIYVPPPDRDAALEILRIHLRATPLHTSVSIDELADQCVSKHLSGAEIEALCREGATDALRDDFEATKVCQTHFLKALISAGCGGLASELDMYEAFERGQERK